MSEASPTAEAQPTTLWKAGRTAGLTYLVPILAFTLPFLLFSVGGSLLTILVGGPFGILTKAQHSIPLQLLVIATAVVLHVLATRVYAWQVASIMRQRVGAEAQADGRTAELPVAPVADDGGAAGDVVGAATMEFRTFDASAESLVDTPEERFIRDRLLNRRGKIFFACVLMGLILSVVVGAREWLALARVEEAADPAAAVGGRAQLLLPPAVAVALLIGLYVQRLSVGIRSAVVVGFIANVWPLVLALTARYGTVTDGEIPPSAYLLPIGSYLGMLLVGIALSAALTRSTASGVWDGKRLLVLRVFGVDRNTASLFSMVVRRWPFLGPVVTVVDPTYAEVTFGRLRYLVLFVLALPWIQLGTFIPASLPMLPAAVAGYYVVWLPVVCAFALWRLRVGTGRNVAAVRQRLDFDTASWFRRRYPAIQLTCFADVWKSTVGALVEWSDAILMDLRGFTAERQGVAYELRYLMNHCELSRIAFLTDPTTDMALFRATLQSQWRALDPRSPNAGAERAIVHVYAAAGTGRALRHEMRPLLALLGELTTTAPPRQPVGAAAHGDGERIRNRKLSAAIAGAWGLLALGAVLQVTVGWDGMRLGSGICVMWLATLAVMLTTRMRRLLVRDGSFDGLWRSRPWSIAFVLLAMGWAQWYVFIPLQN